MSTTPRTYVIAKQMAILLRGIAARKQTTVSALVSAWINLTEPQSLRQYTIIFKHIRCGRCSQAFSGGSKTTIILDLPQWQIEWLTFMRCKFDHPSIDKTLRVLLDFLYATGSIAD